MPDPFVEDLSALNRPVNKPRIKAGASSQVWTALLPHVLGVGAHRVAAEAQ